MNFAISAPLVAPNCNNNERFKPFSAIGRQKINSPVPKSCIKTQKIQIAGLTGCNTFNAKPQTVEHDQYNGHWFDSQGNA